MSIIIENTMSVAQAAEQTGMHPKTIRRWIKDGILRARRPGEKGRYRITAADLDEAFTSTNPSMAKEV